MSKFVKSVKTHTTVNNYVEYDLLQEINTVLTNGIQAYRKQKGLINHSNVEVVSFSSHTNSTIPDDMLWFDFYHIHGKTYINGRFIQ